MNHVIYGIQNMLSGCIYVGRHSSENLDNKYMGSSSALNRAMRKFGRKHFDFVILEHCADLASCIDAEARIVNREFVARHDTYNIMLGGIERSGHVRVPGTFQYENPDTCVTKYFRDGFEPEGWVRVGIIRLSKFRTYDGPNGKKAVFREGAEPPEWIKRRFANK